MDTETFCGRHSIDKGALADLAVGGKTMEQLKAGHGITIRITCVKTTTGVEGTSQMGLSCETDEACDLPRGVLLHRNVAQESQSISTHVIKPVLAAGWVLNPLGVVTPGKGGGGLPHPRHAGGT
jgi:hypothetical protein